MILYINARTNAKLFIDSIIIVDRNNNEHELTWDEAMFGCSDETNTTITPLDFNGKYKGVYIDGEYGNGKLQDIIPFAIKDIILDESDDYQDNNILFDVESISLHDGDNEFVLDRSEVGFIYTGGEVFPFINLQLKGELFFDDDDSFFLKDITIKDRFGNSHKITWDGFHVEKTDVILNGTISTVNEWQLQGIHMDGEDMLLDTMKDCAPFIIDDIDYVYEGERPDEVWFCVYMFDFINGLYHYRMECDEPIYATSWETPE